MRRVVMSSIFILVPRAFGFHTTISRSTKVSSSQRQHRLVLPALSSSIMRKHVPSRLFSTDAQQMQDILYRVRAVNHMPVDICKTLLPFSVDGHTVGKLRPAVADLLIRSGDDVFCIVDGQFTFTERIEQTSEARTKAVASVMEKLRDEGVVKGWRDELYPVCTSFYEPALFAMERAAVPLVGAVEYGVHINGIVEQDGAKKMWIARRSKTKSKFPGMLDHIVAGGQPVGISLLDNVVKECLEEAGIPKELTLAGVQAAGAISYECYSDIHGTVSRAVLFSYDLFLPEDFEPRPVDGEVEEFFLWTMDQVLESMARDYPDPIKPNCYPIIIDYLLRQGLLSPEVPGYLDVLRELRSGECR